MAPPESVRALQPGSWAQRLGLRFWTPEPCTEQWPLCCVESGASPDSADLSARIATTVKIEALAGHVYCDGRDVGKLIRTPEVSQAASIVAQNPEVRQALVQQQRDVAIGRDIVSEGRDQGTIVFPHAECKFFLTADPEERARRRHRENGSGGALHGD